MPAALTHDIPFRPRLTVDDFVLLDAAGAFTGHAKTELIDGVVTAVNAQYAPHFTAKTRLLRRLADACDALGTGLEAWSEGSIAIPPHDVPEPDLFVTRTTPVDGLVAVDTVALVVEIAVSTLATDLGAKVHLYAGAGIAEYWVVDIAARVIHRQWHAVGRAYRDRDRIAFETAIASATIPGLTLSTMGL